MEKLSRFDVLQFSEYYADLKFLETKTGKYFIKTAKLSDKTSRSSEETCSPQKIQDKELNALLRTAAEMVLIYLNCTSIIIFTILNLSLIRI